MRARFGTLVIVLSALFGLGGCAQILGLDGLTDLPTDASSGLQGPTADGAGDTGPMKGEDATAADTTSASPDDEAGDGAGIDGWVDGGGESGADAAPVLAPKLAVGSPTLSFGTVTVGQTVSPGTIDVSNQGTAATAALTTAIAGAGFSVMTDGCKGMTLVPKAVCHIQIALADSTAGTPSGTMTITDTASDAITVPLQANIVTPGALSVAPQSNDFKSWLIGASSPSQTFTVTNTGMSSSGTLAATLTPTNGTMSTEFAVSDSCAGKQLIAGGTCTISVVFTPAARGARSATLSISANPGGTAVASLSGTGQIAASLSISPAPSPFPATLVSATPPQQTFTVTNVGDQTTPSLSTSVTAGSNTTSSEFSIAGNTCAGATLAAGASCTIPVQFVPATYGPKSGTLTVNGGAAGSPSVTLSGTGQDTLTLTIAKSGAGGGTVTDASGAINCGSTCSAGFTRTTSNPIVSLTAAPDGTSVFNGWSGGGCSGTGTCSVTLSAATTVTASFSKVQEALTVKLRMIGAGQSGGSITSSPAGISCSGPVCSTSASFDEGTAVKLTVSGVASGAISAWLPASCSGSTCTVTMNAATTVQFTSTTNNLIFVTSTQVAGNFGGVSPADTMCGQSATAAGLPGSYIAWIASPSVTAVSRLGSARGWIRPDGQPFADTVGASGGKTGFTNGQIYFPPEVNELGSVMGASVWAANQAGADDQVNPSSYVDCTGWSSASSSVVGANGFSAAGSRDWASTYIASYCNTANSLYCLGTNLTTPVTPATTTGRHAFVSVGIFGPATGIASADSMCQSEASSAGLANAANFKALLATNGASAASRFNLSGANWIRPDGLLIASSITNLFAGNLLVPIAQHADGSYMHQGDGSYNWSGAADPNTAGTAALTCNNWSSNASSSTGESGFASEVTLSFFGSWNADPCNGSNSVFCFEN